MPDTASNARECDPNSDPRHKTLAHETCHLWQSTSDCGEQLRMICGDGCLAECWADAQNNEWKKQRSVLPNIDFNISEQEGFFINIKQWGNIDLERQIEEFN